MTTDEFLSKYDKVTSNEGCWLWTGAVSSNGYGWVSLNGHRRSAHRAAFQHFKGNICNDVLHKCNNRLCGNPDHLYDGTAYENARDRTTVGRTVGVPPRFAYDGHVPGALFTDKTVKHIRELYATGKYTFMALGYKFNVSNMCISNIVKRRTYGHVV